MYFVPPFISVRWKGNLQGKIRHINHVGVRGRYHNCNCFRTSTLYKEQCPELEHHFTEFSHVAVLNRDRRRDIERDEAAPLQSQPMDTGLHPRCLHTCLLASLIKIPPTCPFMMSDHHENSLYMYVCPIFSTTVHQIVFTLAGWQWRVWCCCFFYKLLSRNTVGQAIGLFRKSTIWMFWEVWTHRESLWK